MRPGRCAVSYARPVRDPGPGPDPRSRPRTPVSSQEPVLVSSQEPVLPPRPTADPQPVIDPTVTGGPIRRLIGRFQHLFHELGKFGTVGGVAFVVDAAIFNTLYAMRVEILTAGAVSTVVAATVAFLGNRFWTWRHRERSGLHREYVLYFLFNGVGLAIAVACLAVSRYGLGQIWPVLQTQLADNVAKLGVGTALGTTFRFWSYRRFVFRAPKVVDPPRRPPMVNVDA